MEIKKTVKLEKDVQDLTGWTITEGTTIHVVEDKLIKHPNGGYLIKVRVDNGTGDLNLMSETVIKDSDL